MSGPTLFAGEILPSFIQYLEWGLKDAVLIPPFAAPSGYLAPVLANYLQQELRYS